MPEEGVVPDLRGIVEYASIEDGSAGSLVRGGNDRLERESFVVGSGYGVIQLVDVSLVVLAVVELESSRGNMRFQRIDRIGQIRQCKTHWLLLRRLMRRRLPRWQQIAAAGYKVLRISSAIRPGFA